MDSGIVVLNGLYPYNPLWQVEIIVILLFEIVVIFIEYLIVMSIDRVKHKRLFTALVLGNIATFIIGLIMNTLIIQGVFL